MKDHIAVKYFHLKGIKNLNFRINLALIRERAFCPNFLFLVIKSTERMGQ